MLGSADRRSKKLVLGGAALPPDVLEGAQKMPPEKWQGVQSNSQRDGREISGRDEKAEEGKVDSLLGERDDERGSDEDRPPAAVGMALLDGRGCWSLAGQEARQLGEGEGRTVPICMTVGVPVGDGGGSSGGVLSLHCFGLLLFLGWESWKKAQSWELEVGEDDRGEEGEDCKAGVSQFRRSEEGALLCSLQAPMCRCNRAIRKRAQRDKSSRPVLRRRSSSLQRTNTLCT